MKKIKTYLIDNKWLLILLALMLVIVFGTYLIGSERFLLGYDYQYQHLYFYQDFHRLIRSGQMPFWSHNLFLGTNFWGSKSYYILGDPFAYITLLFDSSQLVNALLMTYILKFITASLLFNELLKKMGIKNEIRFIPVLMYTFCGWACLFSEHPMFLVWHTFLPLLLLGLEHALNKKYAIFILSVFLLFISNYYFFWTTSVFMTFYWTVRYFQTHTSQFKTYLIDTLQLIGMYLIGVLMGMILILPSVLHLSQNVRVTGDTVITKKWNPVKIYLDMLVKTLIAPYQVSELGHMLFNTTEYSTNQLSIYSSVLTILLVPQIFCTSTSKEKKGFLALLIIFAGLLVTPYGSSLMHGFKEPTFRWTLLLTTCLVIISAFVLNRKESINKKILIGTLLILLLAVVGLRFAATKSYDAIWDHLLPEYNGLLYAGILGCLYTILLLFKHQKILILGCTLLLVTELSLSARATLHRYPDFENYDYENIISRDAIEYIQSLESDNEFYRIYVPYTHTKAAMPHNINLHYNYKGAYTYDSLYQFSLSDFVENELKISAGMWQLDIKNIETLRNLSFKYYLVLDEQFNLGNPRWVEQIVNLEEIEGFAKVAEVDGYLIYEDTLAKPFDVEFTTLKDNTLKGTVLSSNGKVELSIANDSGWSLKVNGVSQAIEDVHGGFIGFEANQNDTFELKYIPPGFIPGAVLTTIGFILYLIICLKEKKK